MIELKYAVFDKRQSLAESFLENSATFGFLLLCVYVSQDSKWWTFVTGTMFLAWIVAKMTTMTSTRYKRFTTKEELKQWVDSL